MADATKQVTEEKPCKPYLKGHPCDDGRDHCYECARHLDPKTATCPKCGK